MICEPRVNAYCNGNYALIENYDKAIADTTKTWHCHHRRETDEGLTADELKKMNLYFKVAPSELIFLTPNEHTQLHTKGEKNPMYGINVKYCMSEDDYNRMLDKRRKSMTGHTHKEESKKLMRENCWFNQPGNEEKKLAAQKKSAETRRRKLATGEITVWNKGKKGVQTAWNKGKKGVQTSPNKGKKYMNNGVVGCWVAQDEINKYIENGYTIGYLKHD